METLENNRLIAEFMGLGMQLHMVEHPITGEYTSDDEMLYHTDWNWLMPVVEKIEALQDGEYTFEIEGCNATIHNTDYSHNSHVAHDNKLDAVYSAVTEFIKWYNQNKQS